MRAYYSHSQIAEFLAEAGAKPIDKIHYVDKGNCPSCKNLRIVEVTQYVGGSSKARKMVWPVGCKCVDWQL